MSQTDKQEEYVSNYLLDDFRTVTRDIKDNQNNETTVSYLNISNHKISIIS